MRTYVTRNRLGLAFDAYNLMLTKRLLPFVFEKTKIKKSYLKTIKMNTYEKKAKDV